MSVDSRWPRGVDAMTMGHAEMAAAGFDVERRIDESVKAMLHNNVAFTWSEIANMLALAVDRLANGKES